VTLPFAVADLAILAGVFLLAGTVKGLVGIGLPTASVGLMSQVMEPRLAIALVVFPSLLSNAWQMYRSGNVLGTICRFWLYIVTLMVTIGVVTMAFTSNLSTDLLILILGGVIVLFSVSSLAWAPPFLPARFDRLGQVMSGLASGVLGGLTAIWAPAMVTYLMARRIDKEAFVQATGVMIFMGTIPLILGFAKSGMLTGPMAGISFAMTVPAIAGFSLGERLRRGLDADRFRTAVLVIFLIMGLNLIRKALL